MTYHNKINNSKSLGLQLNLASPAVLECLNAALDHRGELFVPELNRTFPVRSDTAAVGGSSFRLFAAQNPLHEGGGRRGLPRSFLNRFVIVQCEQLTAYDYSTIVRTALHGALPPDHIGMLLDFLV